SFALKLKGDKHIEPDCLDISFTGNITAFSNNGNPLGTLPVINKTIPYEITPKEIYVDGVNFTLPENGKALLCGGQTLILPNGTKRVHLLAASLNGDKTVKIGNGAVTVNDIREYYGGWDIFGLNEKAHIKNGKLGFEFTHSHTDKGDAQCEQLFFWKITVNTEGQSTLSLPVDRDILVLSAIADGEESTCRIATELYDKVPDRDVNFKIKQGNKILSVFKRMGR
ncbi:MAG: hypothetical protein ACI4SX_00605, partial [Candidatus Fimenecus sp.]